MKHPPPPPGPFLVAIMMEEENGNDYKIQPRRKNNKKKPGKGARGKKGSERQKGKKRKPGRRSRKGSRSARVGGNKKFYKCGGSLITDTWVLTAASCFEVSSSCCCSNWLKSRIMLEEEFRREWFSYGLTFDY